MDTSLLLNKAEWRRHCINLTTMNLDHCKTVEAMELQFYRVEVPSNGINSIQHFSQICGLVQKLWRETHRQVDRHTDNFISLLSFFESRLKTDLGEMGLQCVGLTLCDW
jgi:hypothetical protein